MSSQIQIQIVDKNDNPVGGEDMLVAQKKGLIHRIVRVMVEDKNGRVLLQKRSAKMKRWPNCWDNSAAGHVDLGEEYDFAAKRELFEEIGIKRDKLEELGRYYTDRPLGDILLRRFNRVYKTIANVDEPKIDEDEVSAVKWVTYKELSDLVKKNPDNVTDGLMDVYDRYYSK